MLRILIFTAIPAIVSALANQKLDLTNGRIIGGQIVSIEQFPFQVCIQNRGMHDCGGSIISRDFVLTAAHCLKSRMQVRAGSNLTTEGGSLHRVVQTIEHEDYSNMMVPRNDIALLRVKPPFKFDDTRRPIKLHEDEKEVKDGAPATVSGFGVADDGHLSDRLRAVTVKIVNRKSCSRAYEGLGFPSVTEDTICAGVPEGGKDSCQGDSGGPLVVDGRLAGIVSYGFGCAQPEIPGVYTNVAHFNSWIKNQITKAVLIEKTTNLPIEN